MAGGTLGRRNAGPVQGTKARLGPQAPPGALLYHLRTQRATPGLATRWTCRRWRQSALTLLTGFFGRPVAAGNPKRWAVGAWKHNPATDP